MSGAGERASRAAASPANLRKLRNPCRSSNQHAPADESPGAAGSRRRPQATNTRQSRVCQTLRYFFRACLRIRNRSWTIIRTMLGQSILNLWRTRGRSVSQRQLKIRKNGGRQLQRLAPCRLGMSERRTSARERTRLRPRFSAFLCMKTAWSSSATARRMPALRQLQAQLLHRLPRKSFPWSANAGNMPTP